LFNWNKCNKVGHRELYLRAATIYTSRSFPSELVGCKVERSLFGDNDDEELSNFPVLIPLVDVLNHKPFAKVVWEPTSKEFSIFTLETLKSGSQIFNNYGPKPNEELLMGYGFVIQDNPVDSVALKFNVPLLSNLKKRIWMQKHSRAVPESEVFHLAKTSNSLHTVTGHPEVSLRSQWPETLVDLFRLLFANEHEEEVSRISRHEGMISPANEYRVALQLKMAMERKASGIEQGRQDEKHIASTRSHKAKLAEIYRNGQEAIIKSKILHLDNFIERHRQDRRVSMKDLMSKDLMLAMVLNNTVNWDSDDQQMDFSEDEVALLIALLQARSRVLSKQLSDRTDSNRIQNLMEDTYQYLRNREMNRSFSHKGGDEFDMDACGSFLMKSVMIPLRNHTPGFIDESKFLVTDSLLVWIYQELDQFVVCQPNDTVFFAPDVLTEEEAN
jgi:hypothetical protein